MKLADALRDLVNLPVAAELCQVLWQEGEVLRCKPVDGGAPLEATVGPAVPVAGQQSAVTYQVPVGSYVIAVRIGEGNTQWVAILYSALEAVVLMGGENGGLVKVSALVAQLNRLEAKVAELVQFCATHTHPGNGSAATPPTPLAMAGADSSVGLLENPKVKH